MTRFWRVFFGSSAISMPRVDETKTLKLESMLPVYARSMTC